MMRADIAQRHWLRSRPRILGIGCMWLLYAAFFVWIAFHHTERTAGGGSVSPVLTIMLLVLAVPGLVLGVRELRSGLWIASDAVIVRGMFRTTMLSPNEIDGFKPEMRLAPSPLVHRKHGTPLIVGALAHGGFSKRTQADCLKALEPLCDQLNALLESVRSEQPSRTPDALSSRPSDRRASYETAGGSRSRSTLAS